MIDKPLSAPHTLLIISLRKRVIAERISSLALETKLVRIVGILRVTLISIPVIIMLTVGITIFLVT